MKKEKCKRPRTSSVAKIQVSQNNKNDEYAANAPMDPIKLMKIEEAPLGGGGGT